MLKRCIVIALFSITNPCFLQAFTITGKIPGAAKCYYPRVYLAAIDDIENFSGISSRLVIAQADMDSAGTFEIKGDFLPADKRFYRLYLTPDKNMNAYISVGQNENFVLLVLDNASHIQLQCNTICTGFPVFEINGMAESAGLKALKQLEITSHNGLNDSISETKQALLVNQVINSYKQFADTSQQVLPSLVAVMAVLQHQGYMASKPFADAFLARLKKQLPQSPYTAQFEKLVNDETAKSGNAAGKAKNYFIGFVAMLLALLVSIGINIYLVLRLKKQQPIMPAGANTSEADVLSSLTIKEKQILLMVDEGLSNKEIAEKLNVEVSTVKSHVSRIYQKTNIQNRSQVAKIARLLR